MADPPPRFITPDGFARIRAEYEELFGVERPKVVEIVSWAASLGDRSENADYLYGKKRLREIDRRLSHLSKIMKAAKVVDPASQAARDQVRFGATVELADEDDNRRTLTIVGDDEADASAGRIGWSAPLARALVGARIGDERTVRLPAGEKSYEVMTIRYPD
jgi:transcription elongation factor GreB